MPQSQNNGGEMEFQQWMNRWWRPLMAYTYIAICIFDFIVAPIGWAIIQSMQGIKLTAAWDPITLKGAGLFHAAMGAILGVTAWGRSQEKLARIEPYYSTKRNSYEESYEENSEDSPAVRYQPRGK